MCPGRGVLSGRSLTDPEMSMAGQQLERPHRVVIVGAGFGGLFATRALKRADVEITLINGTAYHLFQPLLYQVATGILSEGEIAPPIREVLRGQDNVDVRLGWVKDVNADAKLLTVAGPGIDYTV